jgi:amidophosphoribosyltransferase
VFSAEGADVFGNVVEGLFQMQHRGQDACGIAISDGERIRLHKSTGYVRQVFAERAGDDFAGNVACGHVRYPTAGANRIYNAQPHLFSDLTGTRLAVSSNGDITNYAEARNWLEREGVGFVGSNDAELILKTIAWYVTREDLSVLDAIRAMQARLQGAYSTVVITRNRLYAVRDPFGFRPLCFGGDDGFWVVASETNALDTNFVDLVDDVPPGEIIEFTRDGYNRHPHPDLDSLRHDRHKPAHCIFEYVYFSRPDSIAFGQRVYDVRKRIGERLAALETNTIDVVVPVPDSSTPIAMGYSQGGGVPFELGLVRNHYVGRTFINPNQARRDEGVRQKFNPIRSVFKDKRVALVDDSLVRGTTLRKLVRMVRNQGATEVHVRIGSPVTLYSCFYGVDTPTRAELIGSRMDVESIRKHIEADSLVYLPLEDLKECVGDTGDHCVACFNGDYPVPITEEKFERGLD